MSARCPRVLLLVLAALVSVAGCTYEDGRTLKPPPEGATLPPYRTSTTTLPPVDPITIASTDWPQGGAIPERFLCDGDAERPSFSWTGAPASSELVVMISDGQGDRQLVVADIDPGVTEFPAGPIDIGNVVLGDLDDEDWNEICPAAGSEIYYLSVYALNEPSGLVRGVEAFEAQERVDKITIGRGVYEATGTT